MAKLLYRLGKWCYAHAWKVIGLWIVLLVGFGITAFTVKEPFTGEFAISGTPAIQATVKLRENFPDRIDPVKAATVNVVFHAPEGETLDTPRNMQTIDAVVNHIQRAMPDIKQAERFGNPLVISPILQQKVKEATMAAGSPAEAAERDAENLKMVSDDRTIAYTTFAFNSPNAYEVAQSQRDVVNEALEIGRKGGLDVQAGGVGFADPIAVKPTSEIIGLGAAFIILCLTFGSLAAAGMPVITALIGVGLGVLLIVASTAFLTLNNITPVLATMIGLAVGIDYALFIMSRYRSEAARRPRQEAMGVAVGTAGSAVVFAGATVLIALAALFIANIQFLTYMGIGAAITVAVSVAVALTFLPALLGALGDRAFAIRIPGVAGNPSKRGAKRRSRTMGHRWVTFVRKAPALVIALVVLGLGALAAPTLRMELSLPSDVTGNVDTTQRKAADLMTEAFGPGIHAPFLFIVNTEKIDPQAAALQPFVRAQRDEARRAGRPFNPTKAAQMSTYAYTAQQANSLHDVKHAQIVSLNGTQTAAQILITPTTGAADGETVETAAALRNLAAEIENSTGADVGLTGLTAVQMDITEELEKAMPVYLGVVVGLAILLLLLVFRSIMVPLVAGLGFLLSVSAAFGMTVLVWQEGAWGLVNAPAPLVSFMPIFLIGVTFGLAMDYQVFLVTRMREHYVRDAPATDARLNRLDQSVIMGFSDSARVVTAAALIMISVFVAFVDQPLPFIQIFGFALGMGVLFDAFLIRMALVPASMYILGDATWWIPRWLDRLLPRLDVEGTSLEEELEAAEAAAGRDTNEKEVTPA